MQEPASNRDTNRWPEPIVVSRPGAVLRTQIIPLNDEWRRAFTVTPSPPRPPRRDSMFNENGYLKPPRLPRPANLRWWERLAYAWRGL